MAFYDEVGATTDGSSDEEGEREPPAMRPSEVRPPILIGLVLTLAAATAATLATSVDTPAGIMAEAADLAEVTQLDEAQGTMLAFRRLDANGDARVDLKEFQKGQAMLEQWLGRKIEPKKVFEDISGGDDSAVRLFGALEDVDRSSNFMLVDFADWAQRSNVHIGDAPKPQIT